MRRRLLVVAAVGAASAVLTACGDLHPGAAIVIDDGDYRVSMDEVDELTAALCQGSRLSAEAQGQPAQESEAIEARQYITGLLIQSYVTPLAAEEAGASAPSPQELAVSPDDYTNVTDQMDEDRAEDFLSLLEILTEVGAWQANIGLEQPDASPTNAAGLGLQYVLNYADDLDVDIDPRLGIDGDDLQAEVLPRSGSISVAESSQATAREDPAQAEAVVESLPSTQVCR